MFEFQQRSSADILRHKVVREDGRDSETNRGRITRRKRQPSGLTSGSLQVGVESEELHCKMLLQPRQHGTRESLLAQRGQTQHNFSSFLQAPI
ncbi:hypothetical protein CEXT_146481 [Caerostris extrusa]|uniref:Uncharacterized protein n=1 Tax=Caerostris extrusa TaxID=172846 RepID=A0AAV4MLJ0_CAEEX|nr:hypothetical protein CEXT_146481 [Caerostris extrusa]